MKRREMVRPFFHEFFHTDLVGIALLVTRDNSTRWNSTYDSIHRALKLKVRIIHFTQQNQAELKDDALSDSDWEALGHVDRILKPFKSLTKRLEGHAVEVHHGAMWEALPTIKALINHLDQMKKIYTQEAHPELTTSVNLAWSKLDDCYKKLGPSASLRDFPSPSSFLPKALLRREMER